MTERSAMIPRITGNRGKYRVSCEAQLTIFFTFWRVIKTKPAHFWLPNKKENLYFPWKMISNFDHLNQNPLVPNTETQFNFFHKKSYCKIMINSLISCFLVQYLFLKLCNYYVLFYEIGIILENNFWPPCNNFWKSQSCYRWSS